MPVTGSKNLGKIDVSLLDETFDQNQSLHYHLSIQCQLNGFSFCILDTQVNKYVVLKNYQFPDGLPEDIFYEKLEEIVAKEDLLSLPYKSSSIIFITKKIVIIPSEYFEEDGLKDLFLIHHNMDDLDELHFDKILIPDCHIVYTIPHYVANLFVNTLKNITFLSHATSYLNLIFESKKLKSQPVVHISVFKNSLDLVVCVNKRLILYNTFLHNSENDIVYYISVVFNRLNLDPSKTEIILSGYFINNNCIALIQQFFKKVSFEKQPFNFSYSYTFGEIPSHSFVNLLNTYNCVS